MSCNFIIECSLHKAGSWKKILFLGGSYKNWPESIFLFSFDMIFSINAIQEGLVCHINIEKMSYNTFECRIYDKTMLLDPKFTIS